MCALYIIVLGVLLLRRFHREEWRNIRIFESKRGAPVTESAEDSEAAEESPTKSPGSAEVAEVY